MRKALALLLALVLAASAGAVKLVQQLAATEEQVVFTETTRYGNISAAEGLHVEKQTQLNWNLIWESSLNFFNAGFTSHTRSSYARDAWYVHEESRGKKQEYQGVFLYSDIGNSYTTSGGDLSFLLTGVDKAQQELINETPDGQQGEKTIRLADYYDYYPMMVNVELPGIIYGYPDAMDLDVDKYESPEIYAVQTIHDFFKIPMLPQQQYTIGVEKTPDGMVIGSWGSTPDGEDSYSPYSISVVAEDACYFYINNRTDMTNTLVDTSQIPGGYGIYVLPYGFVKAENYLTYDSYEGMDVFADELRLFYPVDPESEILSLTLSENEKTLLLHTREEGRYLVTVISTETGKQLQQLDLGALDEQTPNEVVTADDTVVVRINNSFSVLSPTSDTQWALQYQTVPTPMEEKSSYSPLNTWHGRQFAFDGERLAVICCQTTEDGWSGCGFDLAVYNSAGLQYYGSFESSLSRANEGGNQEQLAGYQRVRDMYEPNHIRWGE